MTTGKRFAEKVRAQTVREHRDIQFINHINQLTHLCPGQKLRFINENTIQLGGVIFFFDNCE